jgi:hypothetical protein
MVKSAKLMCIILGEKKRILSGRKRNRLEMKGKEAVMAYLR